MITTVKLFGSEDHHINEYEKIQNNSFHHREKSSIAEIQFSMTYHMLEVFCFSSIVYTGMKFIDMDIISPEKLTSFFLIFKEFQHIIGNINWHLRNLTKEFPELEKFNWFLNSRSNMENGKEIYNFNNETIELQNVSFRYPSRPETKIIDGLNLKFAKNKTTALVGDSGSGKSTISKLISRLYDPEEGRVLLGDKDLKNYDTKNVLKNFAIVTQKPEFFVSTIRDNLTYSHDRIVSDEEIISACEKAECYDFIMDLPYKLETIMYGDNLSGGQNQRISIARAILRNPNFLILDEATSSLDAENEFKITETLGVLMKNKTVIVIAHRLSTIKNADEIVCLKNGKIVERGTHEDLLLKAGYYKNLIQNQL